MSPAFGCFASFSSSGRGHLEACPNRPRPEEEKETKQPKAGDTEAPATDLLLREVGKTYQKHNIVTGIPADITAMECRLLLTKRTKADVEKVIKTIESARKPML